jgi:uncharacterized membrane protein YbaN (DUF454 family)
MATPSMAWHQCTWIRLLALLVATGTHMLFLVFLPSLPHECVSLLLLPISSTTWSSSSHSFHDWLFKDQILSMASMTRPSSSSHWFWKCDRNSRMWMSV